MRTFRHALCLLAATMSIGAAQAADDWGPADTSSPADKLSQARTLIAAQDWPGAIKELHRVGDTGNANWNNLMGYALRKQRSPDFEAAHWYYDQALRIDRHHSGALAYSGELFLMTRDLPMAQQRLQTLAAACDAKCPEYAQLKAAIERYRAAPDKYVSLVR